MLRFVLNVEHIEEWRGQHVLDCDGQQIGKLEEVFYDVASGEPVLLSVKSGLLGRHLRLIPLAGASVGHDYVRVAYGSEEIEEIEHAEDSSAQGILGREQTDRIAALYGLDLAEGIELESASVIAGRRAQAEEARRRAGELAREAHKKDAEREDAQRRERSAAAETELTRREAEQATRAAAEARQAANAAEPHESSGQTE